MHVSIHQGHVTSHTFLFCFVLGETASQLIHLPLGWCIEYACSFSSV